MEDDLRERYEGRDVDNVVHLDNVKYGMLQGSIKPSEATSALHGELRIKLPIKQCKKHTERFEV